MTPQELAKLDQFILTERGWVRLYKPIATTSTDVRWFRANAIGTYNQVTKMEELGTAFKGLVVRPYIE